MLMNATVSPGTTVKLDGVNSKLVPMTLWSASHWPHTMVQDIRMARPQVLRNAF